ncbi:MAG: outer membrane beta-barrel family protein [Ignavibacteriaceae bacterium]|nr:outer membrane beta-barrel family protein [Ignavibacteriaceae bacterium]
MRKFSLTIIILFLNIIVLAQQSNRQAPGNFQGTIKGKVIDISTSQPIDYANITLFNPKDSTVVNGTVSDETGVFNISQVNPGRYYAKVTFIGYKTNTIKSVVVTPKKSIVDLGTISLTSSAVKLGEVVVKGDKDMVVTNLDKQVINVDKDLSSSGGTALDVMQNIPSLTVDIDGNVSLRGNSNVTILIDGKPSGLAGLQSSDVLTSIPASSIKSVELVTNPSAKYDPDGTAGIINIVLKKKSNLGFNGIFNLNAGTGDKYNGSANLNYRTGDFNFFGNFGGRIANDDRVGATNRTNYYTGNTTLLNQTSSSTESRKMGNINLGADYLLNDFNTFTFNFQYRNFSAPNNGTQNNTTTDELNDSSAYYQTLNNTSRYINSYTYTTSYKKEFEKKDEVLTADVIYSNNSMTSNSSTDNILYSLMDSTGYIPYKDIKNTSNNFNNEWTVQSNYVNPLGDNNRMEVGFKSYIRHLGMDYNFYNYDGSNDIWVNNYNRSNNFDYKQQIHAIYGIYTGAAGDFKYQAGVRGEYTNTNSKLLNNNQTFNDQYRSLYPSIYVAYDFTPLQELKISYSRRVDRPNPWQLNPFINYSDSLNLSYGNPDLRPQYTNSYELGYSTVFFDFNITSSVFYKQTSGLITQISTLTQNNVTETTFLNISDEKNYGAELIGNGSFFPWWRFNANVSYFRRDINDPYYINGLSNYSYSYTGRVNSTWMLNKTLSFQISSTYNSPSVSAQGKVNAVTFTDFALKKDFSQNLSATLRISDIFNQRRYSSETYGDGFVSFNSGRRDSRVLYLGISYNLNNYKQSKDKVKDINNDEEMIE